MKKLLVAMCAICMLAGCNTTKPKETSAPVVEVQVDETKINEVADAISNIQPGTAGCSLKAAYAASVVLNDGEQLLQDEELSKKIVKEHCELVFELDAYDETIDMLQDGIDTYFNDPETFALMLNDCGGSLNETTLDQAKVNGVLALLKSVAN